MVFDPKIDTIVGNEFNWQYLCHTEWRYNYCGKAVNYKDKWAVITGKVKGIEDGFYGDFEYFGDINNVEDNTAIINQPTQDYKILSQLPKETLWKLPNFSHR